MFAFIVYPDILLHHLNSLLSAYIFLQEVDPSVENDDLSSDGPDNFVSELANAIPGIDEAMSFAEMLK